MEPIQTERLLIRRLVPADLADFLAYQRQPGVLMYMPSIPMTDEQASTYLAKQAGLNDREQDSYHAFAVYHRSDGRVIGDVGFYLYVAPEQTADLGFQFHPLYHGQGYAIEAARAVLRLGFLHWDLRRITSSCDARNTASFRLMERLGMRREAHFRQSRVTKGVLHDEFIYAILRDEWLDQNGERYARSATI